jgi:Tfp pilus assembly protein PilN
MIVPTSFDYLRPLPTLEEGLFSCRVPRPLRAACRALSCACLFAVCAWAFEGARLHQATQAEERNSKRYAEQRSVLVGASVHEKRARLLADLDRRIRVIAGSGTQAARRLAALSADLPGNVWITAITPDTNGVLLDGRTRDLTGLSNTLVRLDTDPLFTEPSLLSAQVTTTAVASLGLRFSLHLAGGGP